MKPPADDPVVGDIWERLLKPVFGTQSYGWFMNKHDWWMIWGVANFKKLPYRPVILRNCSLLIAHWAGSADDFSNLPSLGVRITPNRVVAWRTEAPDNTLRNVAEVLQLEWSSMIWVCSCWCLYIGQCLEIPLQTNQKLMSMWVKNILATPVM